MRFQKGSISLFITLILILLIIIVLIDIIPIFRDWLSRIYIGRYKDLVIWENTIKEIGISWLKKTPKIKVTDNTRLVFIDFLKGNYSKNTIQHWQEALLILGLIEALKVEKNSKIEHEIKRYLDSKFDKNGQWREKPKHIDAAILAYTIMKIEFIKIDDYKLALDYLWELIRKHIGKDGTVAYRSSMENYRYVDTIGFICPFLVLYGQTYNKQDCIELAINQIQEYEKYGMLNLYNIPCHAYRISDKAPLGLYGWGRGLGWLALGIIDTYKEININSKEISEVQKLKKVLEPIIIKLTQGILSTQQENGAWNWTVTRNEVRADSSTTSILCWFLINLNNKYGLEDECNKSIENALSYLMKVTRRNGIVDFSQGDTKDIGVYSLLFNKMPFTQGMCIRLVNRYLSQKDNQG